MIIRVKLLKQVPMDYTGYVVYRRNIVFRYNAGKMVKTVDNIE